MPSEGSVHVRSLEHARRSDLRMVHMPGMTTPASSVPVRLSPTRQVPDLEGCTRHSCDEPRSPPGASRDVTRTMPRPRLCRAAVVLVSGLTRPARRPTRRPCLGHVLSQPRPAAATPPGHPTDRRRHLRRNDRETEAGREPQSGRRQVVRQQRPDPAHRDGHQPPVPGAQYPHPPDSGTHLHRDHPAGLRNDPRRTATGTPPAPKSRAPTSRAVVSGCARPPTSAPAPPVREPSPQHRRHQLDPPGARVHQGPHPAVLHGLPLRPFPPHHADTRRLRPHRTVRADRTPSAATFLPASDQLLSPRPAAPGRTTPWPVPPHTGQRLTRPR